MKNDLHQFLAEGMKRYGQAIKVMKTFFDEVETRLHEILIKRKEWGKFDPDKKQKVRSTKYWTMYPFINAQIYGSIEGKSAIIEIAVNWFQSENKYPFYWARFYSPRDFDQKIEAYEANRKLKQSRFGIKEEGRLILYPKPNDYDLDRDFKELIDEFLKALE